MIGVEPGRRCGAPTDRTVRDDHAAAAGVAAEGATQALDPRPLRRRGVIEVRGRRYADAREGSPRGVAGGGYGGISHAEDGLVREHAEDASKIRTVPCRDPRQTENEMPEVNARSGKKRGGGLR